jgi:hypothetical protein
MRFYCLAGFVFISGLFCGCSSPTPPNTAPISDEEKRKIAENDRAVEAEESPGNKTLKPRHGRK